MGIILNGDYTAWGQLTKGRSGRSPVVPQPLQPPVQGLDQLLGGVVGARGDLAAYALDQFVADLGARAGRGGTLFHARCFPFLRTGFGPPGTNTGDGARQAARTVLKHDWFSPG